MRTIIGACFSVMLLLGACARNAEVADSDKSTWIASESAMPEAAMVPQNANDPFMPAKKQMHERMMAAQGANAAEAWARKMIEHHRGAVQMSEVLLSQQGVPAEVAEQGRKTAADQRQDIGKLEAMLQNRVSGSGSASAFAPTEQQMQQQMMAAMGADPAQTWLKSMIEHHRGAIAMSNTAIAQGGNREITTMARETIQKQGREIEEMQRMLQG